MQSAKHIIFIVRYSVLLSKESAGWRIARGSESLEEYAGRLFDPARLASKLDSFERVTLASLASQRLSSSVKAWVLILVSEQMPSGDLDKLQSKVVEFAGRSEMVPVVVPIASPLSPPELRLSKYHSVDQAVRGFMHDHSDHFQDGDRVTTVRLDDDDGLACDFVQMVNDLTNSCAPGFALSFPCGYEATFCSQSGAFSEIRARYFPKIALGLCYFDQIKAGSVRSVMELGNHTLIDERVPVIFDSRRPMYIRSRSSVNDTGTPEFVGSLPLAPSLSAIQSAFPFVQVEDPERYIGEHNGAFSWVRNANLSEGMFRLRAALKRSADRVSALEHELNRLKSRGG